VEVRLGKVPLATIGPLVVANAVGTFGVVLLVVGARVGGLVFVVFSAGLLGVSVLSGLWRVGSRVVVASGRPSVREVGSIAGLAVEEVDARRCFWISEEACRVHLVHHDGSSTPVPGAIAQTRVEQRLVRLRRLLDLGG
jgi:hypothetical protein